MLTPTHLMFALAIAYLLRFPKLPAAIGGVLPDIDIMLQYEFPFQHRGFVHTPLFLAISIVILYLVLDKPTTFAFGAGFLCHLFTDLITPMGIMLLFPIPIFFTLNLVPYNSIAGNLGIIIASFGAIAIYKYRGYRNWTKRTFGINLDLPKSVKGGLRYG